MDRRTFMRTVFGAGAVIAALPRFAEAQQATGQGAGPGATKAPARPAARPAALPQMTVYKSASCGCCHSWVDHVRSNGFTVKTIDTEELPSVKRDLGVPMQLQSCHTVVVGNYLVEGHVPAADVKRMLATKPAIRGIAVPGMPIGSPGMEQGPVSGYQKYEVIAFTAQGGTSIFARH